MRNTNVQIAHQLRDANDREAIANAMIMSEEQRDYLGKCETGRAAVFYTGLQKATFIDIPVYKDKLNNTDFEDFWCGFRDNLIPRLSDEEVKLYMSIFSDFSQIKCLNCDLCSHQYNYRSRILYWSELEKDHINKTLHNFYEADKNNTSDAWNTLVEDILRITDISEFKYLNIAWCFAKEIWFRYKGDDLSEEYKESFIFVSQDIIRKNNNISN